MHCIVTAGPTAEPLDTVRRLTNASTGRLGTVLANSLSSAGHRVTLLLSSMATWHGPCRAQNIEQFTTVDDLRNRLEARSAAQSSLPVDALFHAAAVSDFRFGRIFEPQPSGEPRPVQAGKIPTNTGPLLAELLPTPKLIARLRGWFPTAFLVGWKFEVDGTRDQVKERCRAQLAACGTDLCVANGPAYGIGFGLVQLSGDLVELPDLDRLCTALEQAWGRCGSHRRPLAP